MVFFGFSSEERFVYNIPFAWSGRSRLHVSHFLVRIACHWPGTIKPIVRGMGRGGAKPIPVSCFLLSFDGLSLVVCTVRGCLCQNWWREMNIILWWLMSATLISSHIISVINGRWMRLDGGALCKGESVRCKAKNVSAARRSCLWLSDERCVIWHGRLATHRRRTKTSPFGVFTHPLHPQLPHIQYMWEGKGGYI